MNYYLFIFFSYSIFIAAAIGLYRFRKINAAYHPFVFYTLLASCNELYSYIIVTRYGLSNNANNNMYVLIEALIITWQFYKWDLFLYKQALYYVLQCLFVAVWILDLYASSDMYALFHRYRIYYAAILSLLCLGSINHAVFGSVKALHKDAQFLISAGLIVLYTVKIITELFWLYGLKRSEDFLYQVYAWYAYINFIINLLFSLAVLWIPRKPRYIRYTL